jgi:four helix bundle protein
MRNTDNKREPAKSFRDLIVWQRAHELVLMVYKVTKEFPKDEMYGLTSQFRRAAVSVAANIAEGFKKKSDADKIRIYNISQGSLSEAEYYGILSHDLSYGNMELIMEKTSEVGRLLDSYMKAIKSN